MATQTHEILDLRQDPGLLAPEAFLARFDAWEDGTVHELVHREPFEDLLEVLDRERADRFDWWLLEEEPLRRVLVARRAPGESAGALTRYFAADHERMRGLLEAAREAVATGGRQEVARSVDELRTGMARHVRAEEEVLFPLFEDLGDPRARELLRDLLGEHREIRRLSTEVAVLLGAEERYDQEAVGRALELLWRKVQAHEAREERLLLPLCDRLMAGAEKPDALGRARRA